MWRVDDGCRLDLALFETAAAGAATARNAGDLAAFRAAATEAIGLYRGDLAPGLYDECLTVERDRLRRRCVTVLDQLIDVERTATAYGEAIELAQRRIELQPLEEVGYRTLVQLQGLSGDRAAALQTYHRCESVLERELGIAPDRATIEEYERFAGREPEPAGTPSGPPPPEARVRLIGRERELQTLAECWRDAVRGVVGFAVVSGEAGVGKSRLLEEFSATVQRGGGVAAYARCFAAKGRLPLAPVSEWLRSPALRSGRDRLDEVWAREVDRLVPSQGAGQAARPGPMADSWQRHQFFEGLARAVLAVERPTLLVLDDLQWCDEDTLAWLQLLLRLGQGHPVLLAAGTRIEELQDSPEVVETLRVLRSAGSVTDVELAPLDVAQSAELTAAILGHSAQVDAEQLHHATGGYPLFIVESARSRRLDGGEPTDPGQSPRVRAVLTGRIGQASAAAREIAGLAAAIGRDFSLELVIEACDLDVEPVLEAVDELWRRRIIREHSATSYDFSHDLLRDAAYGEISPPRRKLLHQRVALALETINTADLDRVAAALADQYERAGQPQRAVPHHVRAAAAATHVFANHLAIRHYRRAAELLQQAPAGRDRDAAELAIRQSMGAPLNARYGYASPEQQAVYERCIELADRLGDARRELLSLVGLFGVRFVQGYIEESYDIVKRSLELSALHPDVACQAHHAAGGVLVSLARYEQALEHFALAREFVQDEQSLLTGARVDVFIDAWSAHASCLLGRDADALQRSDRAIAWAEKTEDPYSRMVAQAYGSITNQLRGDRPRTVECAARVQEICARYDFAYYREWATVLQGWCAGGIDGAEQIQAGLRRLRDQDALARHPYYQALLAETLIVAGQGDAAGAVLDAARATSAAHGDCWYLPELWRLDARRHPGPDGESLLHRAIAVADEQSSPALRRRAVDDLAQRGQAANASRTPPRLPSATQPSR